MHGDTEKMPGSRSEGDGESDNRGGGDRGRRRRQVRRRSSGSGHGDVGSHRKRKREDPRGMGTCVEWSWFHSLHRQTHWFNHICHRGLSMN